MRKQMITAAVAAVAVLSSSLAFAGDRGPSLEEREAARQAMTRTDVTYGYQGPSSYSRTEGFTVVRLSEVGDAEAAGVKARATADNVAQIQSSIDAATAAELRAHGVQVNNIVGAAKAFNGNTVYYVK